MRVFTSALLLQVFTPEEVIINATLVQNLNIFCTAAITENMENESVIFCQLIGAALVSTLTPQSRTHPLILGHRGTAAVE